MPPKTLGFILIFIAYFMTGVFLAEWRSDDGRRLLVNDIGKYMMTSVGVIVILTAVVIGLRIIFS